MKHTLSILLILACLFASAQKDTPLELTKKYFSGKLQNSETILTDEATSQNFKAENIPENAKLTYEPLMQNDSSAVINISITENTNTIDLYAFWKKQDVWEIYAFRALTFPAMYYVMCDKVVNLSDDSIDQQYNHYVLELKKKNDTITNAEIIESIGTLEDYRFEAKNMQLSIASDKTLKEHFIKNKEKLMTLLTRVENDTTLKSEEYISGRYSPYYTDMCNLLLAAISIESYNKLIRFVIYGILDNSVGYFYCKDPKDVPTISDKDFFMIRKLGDGWYMYKST